MTQILLTASWWNAAATRAIKTFAQTMIGLIGTSIVVSDVPWQVAISGSLLATLLSFLTSLAGLPEVDDANL